MSAGFTPDYDHPALARARACEICAEHLPLGPKPILRIHPDCKIGLFSQAPGRLAHESDTAWDDPSGRRLRDWLGVDDATFYDSTHFAVLPAGFCYPGKGKGGDLPPRPECAPTWHAELLPLLPKLQLKLLIGAYSQKLFLGKRRKKNLTETVRNYEEYLADGFFPLPHPSPRNGIYLRRNPWIEAEIIPALKNLMTTILTNG